MLWSYRGVACIVTTMLVLISLSSAIDRAPDLMGDYCAARSPKFRCCEGRSDSCTAPVLDSKCYCDEFCKNTTSHDCCPDYGEVCGSGPSSGKTCRIDGQVYNPGQNFRRNCNSCTCKEDGNICCDLTVCVTDIHLIKLVKAMKLGWYPTIYTQFWGRKYSRTLSEIALLKDHNSGTKQIQKHAKYLAGLKSKPRGLPVEFDSRVWSKWRGMISKIANQGWCNTAWAHALVSTINDRLRIHSNGRDITLSVEEMIDCSHSKQHGCLGSGELHRARYYLHKKGLRSERDYRRVVPFQCSNSTKKSRRHRSGPWYFIWGEANIQKEILDSGPVVATMKVYRDFFSYKGGIYRRSNQDSDEEDRSGFLAVKIVGWGETRGTKYWTVANSWGEEWGEDGYFRIRRGTNECGIEDFVFAAWGPSFLRLNPSPSTDPPDNANIIKIIAGPSGRRKID